MTSRECTPEQPAAEAVFAAWELRIENGEKLEFASLVYEHRALEALAAACVTWCAHRHGVTRLDPLVEHGLGEHLAAVAEHQPEHPGATMQSALRIEQHAGEAEVDLRHVAR